VIWLLIIATYVALVAAFLVWNHGAHYRRKPPPPVRALRLMVMRRKQP
jgi:hypothetical protein